ncbi:MAG TPA: hypothetical protein VK746_06960, partial [Candidatus Eisenbacteria bacterium]|nr:hypothetical protein [Candidatus Eisenbacteria bacterium]
VGTRRKLSLSLTASFGALGIFAPGAGLLDFVVNPLVVRAFGRHQELQADQKAVEILRAMGHATPRRSLASNPSRPSRSRGTWAAMAARWRICAMRTVVGSAGEA